MALDAFGNTAPQLDLQSLLRLLGQQGGLSLGNTANVGSQGMPLNNPAPKVGSEGGFTAPSLPYMPSMPSALPSGGGGSGSGKSDPLSSLMGGKSGGGSGGGKGGKSMMGGLSSAGLGDAVSGLPAVLAMY